jgi:hypothetical protein
MMMTTKMIYLQMVETTLHQKIQPRSTLYLIHLLYPIILLTTTDLISKIKRKYEMMMRRKKYTKVSLQTYLILELGSSIFLILKIDYLIPKVGDGGTRWG